MHGAGIRSMGRLMDRIMATVDPHHDQRDVLGRRDDRADAGDAQGVPGKPRRRGQLGEAVGVGAGPVPEGLAHGAANITLADDPGGTALAFAAEGGASGQLMRLGRGLIGNSAQKVIDGFFERFAAAMGTGITALEPLG